MCFNNEVGEAFFTYIMTMISDEDSIKFNKQHDFQESDNKQLTKSNLLPTPIKYLKEEYLLNKFVSFIILTNYSHI